MAGERHIATHYLAREADVVVRFGKRFNLRTKNGSHGPFTGSPQRYAVCGTFRVRKASNVIAEITCNECKMYYIKFIGS